MKNSLILRIAAGGLWLGLAEPAVAQLSARSADLVESIPAPTQPPTEAAIFAVDAGLEATDDVPVRFEQHGVAFTAEYVAETVRNLSGGLRRGAVYHGLFEAALDVDLAKIAGAKSASALHASLLFPHGRSPTGELTGDLQTLSNIDAYEHLTLYELWWEHGFWGDLLSLRAGRLVADAEFATTETGGAFLNSSFGWPAFISFNTVNTGPAFYRSALGLRLRADLTGMIYLQAGVYDGDTFDDPAGDPSGYPSGTHLELSRTQGAFAIAEVGGKFPGAAPGGWKLGAWLHTADFADAANPARSHRRNGGLYAVAEQTLWSRTEAGAGSTRCLTGYIRAGASPADRSPIQFACDAGVAITGVLPSRAADRLGFGLAWAEISGAHRRAERAAGLPIISDRELVCEFSYTVAVNDWFQLQPDVQWISHPGGSRALADSFVVGLRSGLSF